jgi:hypothetical protein
MRVTFLDEEVVAFPYVSFLEQLPPESHNEILWLSHSGKQREEGWNRG